MGFTILCCASYNPDLAKRYVLTADNMQQKADNFFIFHEQNQHLLYVQYVHKDSLALMVRGELSKVSKYKYVTSNEHVESILVDTQQEIIQLPQSREVELMEILKTDTILFSKDYNSFSYGGENFVRDRMGENQ